MKDSKLKRILVQIWEKYYKNKQYLLLKKNCSFKVMSPIETVQYIKEHNCSVARYGDGEFALMLQKGAPAFEHGSPQMASGLLHVFDNHSKKLLICIPSVFNRNKLYRYRKTNFWKHWAVQYQQDIYSVVKQRTGKDYVFGCAEISRPYTTFAREKEAEEVFTELRSLWDNKDILIVEGSLTRLGVGNDLLRNSKSIKRILIPAENAYSRYNEIIESVLKNYTGECVLLAAGPTATILASDLSLQGIQAIDIGHIDIQYEWYQSGNMYQKVPGKYTNEVIGGNKVEDCDDSVYLRQIIDRIL